MKTYPLLLSILLLLAGNAATVCGQSAPDSFDPSANGPIYTIVEQPDGKILVGGDFTTLMPNGGAAVTRNRIARLNADGTLDTTFDPMADGIVYSIAVQEEDGKILVGGEFLNVGGQARNRIARLNTSGSADSWNPNANGVGLPFVHSLVVQTDNKILVGGLFSGIGGQPRSCIARLEASTGLADSLNPGASDRVFSIKVQTGGNLLVNGNFGSIGGQPRNGIARLNGTTGLADSFNPEANIPIIWANATQADGKILVGGQFTIIGGQGGQARSYIARIDPATNLADSMDPTASNFVLSLLLQSDDKILVGGDFNTIGGQTRNFIARLNPDGSADTFDPNANGRVRVMVFQRDGKLLVGGDFTTFAPDGGAPVTRNRIARFVGLGPTPTPGTPTPTPGGPTPTPTPTPTPSPAQALNISTRMRVDTGSNVLIGGFIISGTAPKNVVVRGIGPSLGAFGVPDPLADPTLELHNSTGAVVAQNDNWQDDPTQASQLMALGLAPHDPNESGIVATLPPGTSYTAILAGKNSGTGVGLVEVYDTNSASASQLANISTRGLVLTGSNVMIGGFILGGNSDTHVVVRGIGPSLAQVGIPDFLANPILELHDGNGALLASNDNWHDDASASQLTALGLAPSDALESGLYRSLPPGAFTAILAGTNSGTGIGLVEVYNVQ